MILKTYNETPKTIINNIYNTQAHQTK